MFEIQYEVTSEQIIPPYNHVHHAEALRFLESARLAFLEQIGFPNDDFLGQGLFLVITSIAVKYKRELVAGPIRVTCESPRIEGKLVIMEQRIFNAKGKAAIEAALEFQFLDGALKRAVTPPLDFQRAFTAGLEGLPVQPAAVIGGG